MRSCHEKYISLCIYALNICKMMMMMMMMMAKALMMMSIGHLQLLPGKIINNQSPIGQALKSIKHIMGTRARQ